jgi:hypothetical protein
VTLERTQGGLNIWGPRKDLTRIGDASELESLAVLGRIGSLRGIERMTNLRRLIIEGVSEPDLSSLSGLTRLDELTLAVRGKVDFRPVSGLPSLRVLGVTTDTRAAGHSLAGLDFGALTGLEFLAIQIVTHGGPLPIATDWIGRLPALRHLELRGFVPADGRLDDLCNATHLEILAFTPTAPDDLATLKAALPGRYIVDYLMLPPPQPQITKPKADGQRWFTLEIDLVARWDAPTNYDAEETLRELLERDDPALAARLSWDADADGVLVRADERADLKTVLRLIERGSPPR